MRASDWEFKNRAILFGVVLFIGFGCYVFDPRNIGELADVHFHSGRALFVLGTFLLAVAAILRTWASSYLRANVVYADKIKTASVVADGPFRFVRNPLYLANVLMSVGMGVMMSRSGFCLCVVAMFVFCYRLILREESELRAAHEESYRGYFDSVPRLFPSLAPRVASSGAEANWRAGLKAECWYWGFALALVAFTITLDLKWFFIVTAASIALFWALSSVLKDDRQKTGW
jgi:protein-S-isoprenylcysteine O-methyltransferase Ste14